MTLNTNPRSGKQKKSSILPKILIVLWLLVIVVFIFLVKEVPLAEILSGSRAIYPNTNKQVTTDIPNVGIPEYNQVTELGQAIEISQAPGLSQAEVASSTLESPQARESPADQYKFAIVNRKPTLVFFHSNTCKSCLQMIDTVYEVYPEFSAQVVLIDVDVYDPQNDDLINRVGINYIPTLVFYNKTGDSLFSIGVISSEELRQKLNDISQGKIP